MAIRSQYCSEFSSVRVVAADAHFGEPGVDVGNGGGCKEIISCIGAKIALAQGLRPARSATVQHAETRSSARATGWGSWPSRARATQKASSSANATPPGHIVCYFAALAATSVSVATGPAHAEPQKPWQSCATAVKAVLPQFDIVTQSL